MNGYVIAALVVLGLTLLLFMLFVFAVKPGRRRDASAFAGKFFAHRGLHDGTAAAPENSMAAFARAKEAGYGVEFDVQFTLDQQVVVFHDETLKRVCGVDKKVRELTYEQLQEYDGVIINDVSAQFRNDLLKYCYQNQIRTYVAPKISDIRC